MPTFLNSNIFKKGMKCQQSFKYFSFLLLFLFTLSFVLAQGCADEGWKGNGKIHENKTVTVTCPTCTYINITATKGGVDFLNDVEMVKDGSTFSYKFLGTDLNKVETVFIDGYSNLDTPLALCFDVTMTGNDPSIGTYITLIIISILLFGGLIVINLKFNRKKLDQMYNKIVLGFFNHNLGQDKGNLGTTILFTIAYGLLRNLLMFYYLIIVFFMFMMTELVESFGIDSLIILFTTLLNVFLWGFILVFIVMIFSFYEIIMGLLKDVQDSFSGVYGGR